jgi:hypothetical protein
MVMPLDRSEQACPPADKGVNGAPLSNVEGVLRVLVFMRENLGGNL